MEKELELATMLELSDRDFKIATRNMLSRKGGQHACTNGEF